MATNERVIIENLFRVADKDGNDVDFKLNTAQASIDTHFTGRDIIPKARQEGVSTYYLARFTAKCLYKRNSRCVVISHDTVATQKMLAKVHYFLENIRGPKAVIKTASKNEISFPKTNSVFYIGTAGSRKFGRGDTISNLHCSEYAYWDNPTDLLTGLFQAVPMSGEIGIESTGNGVGNDYHQRCMRAAAGQSRFRLHFLSWHDFPEYTYDLREDVAEDILNNLNPDFDEIELIERFGLTAGQIAWRRDKLEELNYDVKKFQQEYPSTLDECFQASGHSIFHKVSYQPSTDWQRVDSGFYVLKDHPKDGHVYALGADVGGGVDLDNSIIEIVDLTPTKNAPTGEQVAEYATNSLGPDVFAQKIADLGFLFNNAIASVESNNHGIVTLKELLKLYPHHLIHTAFKSTRVARRDESLLNVGVSTTTRSKPLMIGNLRKELADALIIHSELLFSELSTFIEHEGGKLAADTNCKDDRVMAMALCLVGAAQAVLRSTETYKEKSVKSNPFLLDNIISDMCSVNDGFPIGAQDMESWN